MIEVRTGVNLKKKDKGLLRETRFLPNDLSIDTTFIIYTDEISLMVSTKPYLAINIQDKVIYNACKNIFYNLWANADKK